jgi:NAD(P)H-nitrite reductase large subunit
VQPDDTICYCFHVSKRKILNFIRVHEPRVASQISECGGAGTGCGWCIPFLKKYFQQAAARTSDPDAGSVRVAALEPDDLTPDEYARQRGDYIRSGRGVPPPGAIPPPE